MRLLSLYELLVANQAWCFSHKRWYIAGVQDAIILLLHFPSQCCKWPLAMVEATEETIAMHSDFGV